MQIKVEIDGARPLNTQWGFGSGQTAKDTIWDIDFKMWRTPDGSAITVKPMQMRWDLYPMNTSDTRFSYFDQTNKGVNATRIARYSSTDFISYGGQVEETYPRDELGDIFLAFDNTGCYSKLNKTLGDNSGFWLAVVAVGPKGFNYEVCNFRFGWRATWNPQTETYTCTSFEYRVTLFSDGYCVLDYCDASGNSQGTLASGYVTPGKGDISGKLVQLMVMPYRRNSILIWSDQGGYFIYEFSDNTKKSVASGNKINYLQNGESIYQPMVSFPETKGIFQLMQLKFPYVNGLEGAKTVRPTVVPYTAYSEEWVRSKYSSIEKDQPGDSTLAVKYLDSFSEEVDWATGVGQYWTALSFTTSDTRDWEAPVYYKDQLKLPVGNTNSTRSPNDVAGDILADTLRISYTTDPSQRTASFTIRETDGLNYETLHNRVVDISVDFDNSGTFIPVFKGLTSNPKKMVIGTNSRTGKPAERTEFQVQDFWKRLSHTYLKDDKAYDGMRVRDVVAEILEKCGIPVPRSGDSFVYDSNGRIVSDHVVIYDAGATLAKSERDEEDLWRPQAGTSAAEFLTHIKDTMFSYEWEMGFRPTNLGSSDYKIKFIFHNIDTTEYDKIAFSRAGATIAGTDWLLRSDWEEEHNEPEANEWYVVGESEYGEPLVAWGFCPLSQSSTPPPSDGAIPSSLWLGERKMVIKFDNSLNTLDDVRKVRDVLAKNVFRERVTSTITANWRFGLWPGRCIRALCWDADITDNLDYGLWRITGMDVNFSVVGSTDAQTCIDCNYQLERIEETDYSTGSHITVGEGEYTN